MCKLSEFVFKAYLKQTGVSLRPGAYKSFSWGPSEYFGRWLLCGRPLNLKGVVIGIYRGDGVEEGSDGGSSGQKEGRLRVEGTGRKGIL